MTLSPVFSTKPRNRCSMSSFIRGHHIGTRADVKSMKNPSLLEGIERTEDAEILLLARLRQRLKVPALAMLVGPRPRLARHHDGEDIVAERPDIMPGLRIDQLVAILGLRRSEDDRRVHPRAPAIPIVAISRLIPAPE